MQLEIILESKFNKIDKSKGILSYQNIGSKDNNVEKIVNEKERYIWNIAELIGFFGWLLSLS